MTSAEGVDRLDYLGDSSLEKFRFEASGDESFKNGFEVLKSFIGGFPQSPGVYKMYGLGNELLYIGKAVSLKKRVDSYTKASNLSRRIFKMVSELLAVEIIIAKSEAEALLLEASLIKKLKPKYNILLRDDKSYPYIRIKMDHEAPRLEKYRGKKIDKDCFGPFASAWAVTQTIRMLERAFMLRTCADPSYSNRSRPCLQYQIKRCTAPCTKEVAVENYLEQVKLARSTLQGKGSEIENFITEKMNEASSNQNYEEAALYRDRRYAYHSVVNNVAEIVRNPENCDVIVLRKEQNLTCIGIALFRNQLYTGKRYYFPRYREEPNASEILSSFISQYYLSHLPPSKVYLSERIEETELLESALHFNYSYVVSISDSKPKKLSKFIDKFYSELDEIIKIQISTKQNIAVNLKHLADLLKVDSISSVEIYDNSHFSGSYPLGVMVRFEQSGFCKKAYRKFNIRSIAKTSDDYLMMNEVLTRRFANSSSGSLTNQKKEGASGIPDLVIVDGGKGQMSEAKKVKQYYGLDNLLLLAIAKGVDRNAGRETVFFEDGSFVNFDKKDTFLFFLQRLRDEAHRFAINAQRSRYRKKLINSSSLENITGIGAKRRRALLLHFGSVDRVKRANQEAIQMVDGIDKKTAKAIYEYFRD